MNRGHIPIIVQGGRESAKGRLDSRVLRLDQSRAIIPDRIMETTDSREGEMWPRWTALRPVVWSRSLAGLKSPPSIECQIVDLDEIMRAVFDSGIVRSDVTLEKMTVAAVERLRAKWAAPRNVLDAPQTPEFPPGWNVYTSIRDQLNPLPLR